MDDPADSVQEIKSHQYLPSNFLDQIKGQSLVIIPLQDLKQVNTQNFKHHAEMISIRPLVQERVQKIQHMRIIPIECGFVGLVFVKRLDPLWVVCLVSNLLEDLYFVVGGFKVVGRAFHDFYCHVVAVLEVLGEPDG